MQEDPLSAERIARAKKIRRDVRRMTHATLRRREDPAPVFYCSGIIKT
jgi:hypothetical protein